MDLQERASKHDRSKLESPEKEIFDEYTPKLKDSIYGSSEYKQFLIDMKVALDHHYSNNDHHSEHFSNGIQGMNLLSLIEMMVDWYCAAKRHSSGDPIKSVEINQERFGYTDELKQIFINTIKWLTYAENHPYKEI